MVSFQEWLETKIPDKLKKGTLALEFRPPYNCKEEERLTGKATLWDWPRLGRVSFFWGNVEEVVINNCPELKSICFKYNPNLSKVSINNCPLIEKLDFAGCKLENLDLSQLKNLTFLDVSDNKLTSLNVSQNLELEELLYKGNYLSSLDLTHLAGLRHISYDRRPLLTLDKQILKKTVLEVQTELLKNKPPEPSKPTQTQSKPIDPWILGIILIVAVGMLWMLNKPRSKLTHAQELALEKN